MTDASTHEHVNGQAGHSVNGFHGNGIAPSTATPRVTQREAVMNHLLSGKSINPEQARSLYGCQSLTAVISLLRDELSEMSLDVATDRMKDKSGVKFSSYRLVDSLKGGQAWNPSLDGDERTARLAQKSSVVEKTAPPPEPELPKPRTRIGILNVRMGLHGPEIQMTPVGQPEDNTFYELSPTHIRYLTATLKVFAENAEDDKG